MSTLEYQSRARDARDKMIIDLAEAGLSVREIADRVGIEEDYAKKERKRLCPNLGAPGASSPLPFGLTDKTRTLRSNLAGLLRRFNDKGMDPIEIATATGVPVKMQSRLYRNGKAEAYPHDWKLSQIERLAEQLGVEPYDLIMEAMKQR